MSLLGMLMACGGPDATTLADPMEDPIEPIPTGDTAPIDDGIVPTVFNLQLWGAVDSTGQMTDFIPSDGITRASFLVFTFGTDDWLVTADDDQACTAFAFLEPMDALDVADHFPTVEGLPLTEAYEFTLDLDVADSDCAGVVSEGLYGPEAAGLLQPWMGARMGYGWRALRTDEPLYDSVGAQTLVDDVVLDSLFTQSFAFRDEGGQFRGWPLDIGQTFVFDEATSELVYDAEDPKSWVFQSVSDSVKGTPAGPGSLGPAFVRSLPVFTYNLDGLADDLTTDAP
ncbi:MAG: hypothetical protein KTR31_17210 [Myxococcales bacterium]|nr:hypothetical protein [Myxococcales bacterium]